MIRTRTTLLALVLSGVVLSPGVFGVDPPDLPWAGSYTVETGRPIPVYTLTLSPEGDAYLSTRLQIQFPDTNLANWIDMTDTNQVGMWTARGTRALVEFPATDRALTWRLHLRWDREWDRPDVVEGTIRGQPVMSAGLERFQTIIVPAPRVATR